MEKFKYVTSVRYNGGELIVDEIELCFNKNGHFYSCEEAYDYEQFQLKVRDRLGIKFSQK